jgi:hypothetical protein
VAGLHATHGARASQAVANHAIGIDTLEGIHAAYVFLTGTRSAFLSLTKASTSTAQGNKMIYFHECKVHGPTLVGACNGWVRAMGGAMGRM